MRVISCHIDAFGLFRDQTFRELDHPAVVVLGSNEAGKSTFFHFLRAMFYGIYPTDAGKHPYSPRDGRRIEGILNYRLSDGREHSVARRLLSNPQGQLRNGEQKDLRNHTVPAFRHVSRDVFESVYALRLHDLVWLEGSAWEEVQDRLLGSLNIDFIRSVGAVRDELEEEAGQLWRPSQRGNPAAESLKKRRQALQSEAKQACERDEELRALHEALRQHEERLQSLREEQVALRAKRHRIDRLGPIYSLLRRIDNLRSRAGDVTPYEVIPERPRRSLEELISNVSSMEAELNEKQKRLQQMEHDVELLTEQDEKVLEHEAAVRAWSRKVETYQRRKEDVEEMRHERRLVRQNLEETAERLLTEPWYGELGEVVRDLSMAELRERIKEYEAVAEELHQQRGRAETLALHAEARKGVVPWLMLAVLGGAWIFASRTTDLLWMDDWVWGGALALFGVLQAAAAWQHNRKLARQREKLGLQRLTGETEEKAALVEELLAGLPMPRERLRQPDRDLLADVQDLKDAVHDFDACVARLREQSEEVIEASEEVHELAASCGLEPSSEEVADAVALLETLLEEAKHHKQRVEAAENEVPLLRARVEELSANLDAQRERLHKIESLLRELGEGDLRAGIDNLEERRRADRLAARAEETLQADYPNWEERREELEALEDGEVEWTVSDEERIQLEDRLEQLTDLIQDEENERTTKQTQIEHLQDSQTASEVESEIALIDRQLDRLYYQRDRRMLLSNIIKKADFDFRMKHQPDVIQRASVYLERITAGRYERLMLEEGTQRLLVKRKDESFSVPVGPPLSQGTLDQVYLAVRLAIVDHLDTDQEQLPLFLDEVFVNWDTERRRQAMRILKHMTADRQVFVFTCHPYFAREAADFLDARHIRL